MCPWNDRLRPDVAIPLARLTGASLHDRLVDALARILLDADEAMAILSDANTEGLRWIEPHLESVIQELSSVMGQLTD